MKKTTKLKIVFYTLLVLNIVMLVYSFLVSNWFLTIVSFVMALFLSKMNSRIPLPKFFENMNNNKQIDDKNQ